jgi:hypothetical protein
MGIQRQTEGPECVSVATVDRGERAWCGIPHRSYLHCAPCGYDDKICTGSFCGGASCVGQVGHRELGETPGGGICPG